MCDPREMLEALQQVDLRFLTHQQKLAFWLNIYNTCIMHVCSFFFTFVYICAIYLIYLKDSIIFSTHTRENVYGMLKIVHATSRKF